MYCDCKREFHLDILLFLFSHVHFIWPNLSTSCLGSSHPVSSSLLVYYLIAHLISRNLISSRLISLHPRNKNSPRLCLSHHIKSHLPPSLPILSYSLSSLVVCMSPYSHTIVSYLFILYLCLSYNVPVSSGLTVVAPSTSRKESKPPFMAHSSHFVCKNKECFTLQLPLQQQRLATRTQAFQNILHTTALK